MYILTGYQKLGIVHLDQLTGARNTHTYLITTSDNLIAWHGPDVKGRYFLEHQMVSFHFKLGPFDYKYKNSFYIKWIVGNLRARK